MNKIMFSKIALLVLLMAMILPPRGWSAPVLVDGVKLAVNEKIITQREFKLLKQVQIRDLRQRLSGQALAEQLGNLEQNLQQELVNSLLLAIHGEQLSLSVSEKQVERQLDALRRRKGSLLYALGEIQTHKILVRQLLAQQVMVQEVSAKVVISERQVMDVCSRDSSVNYEVDVGHILRREVSVKQRDKLLLLRKRVLAGEKFTKLAVRYSQDPFASRNQGRLGYIKRGQLVRPFEEATFLLKPGQVSFPTQTRFGLHIIKVFARRQIESQDCRKMLSQEKQRFRQLIRKQEEQRRLKNLLTTLRKRSDIHVY